MSCCCMHLPADNRWRQAMVACREFCAPHVLGRKSGRLQALFYQFEGESKTAHRR